MPPPARELGACPGGMGGLTYLGSFVANLSSQSPGPLRARVSLLEERPSEPVARGGAGEGGTQIMASDTGMAALPSQIPAPE